MLMGIIQSKEKLMMQAGGSGIIMGVKAFEKASGISSLSSAGAGTLSSIPIVEKAENTDLGAGWCIEWMMER